MKALTILLATLMLLSCSNSTSTESQKEIAASQTKEESKALTQQQITDLFKKKIGKIDSIFLEKPTLLVTEPFSSSKTGNVYYLIKLTLLQESTTFDIQTTNSIISPYEGFIISSLQVSSNVKAGNVKSTGLTWGFSTEELAKNSTSFTSCMEDNEHIAEEWCIGNVKLHFAFQDGNWVFKSVETDIPNKIQNGGSRRDIKKYLPAIMI